MNYKGEDYKRKYVKAVALKVEHFNFLEKAKGKKSKAGKLDEIIEFYKYQKNI